MFFSKKSKYFDHTVYLYASRFGDPAKALRGIVSIISELEKERVSSSFEKRTTISFRCTASELKKLKDLSKKTGSFTLGSNLNRRIKSDGRKLAYNY